MSESIYLHVYEAIGEQRAMPKLTIHYLIDGKLVDEIVAEEPTEDALRTLIADSKRGFEESAEELHSSSGMSAGQVEALIEEAGGETMTEMQGTLRMLPSGEWAIQAQGREPVNIPAGEIFLLEVLGEHRLLRVRMERKEGAWYAVFSGARGKRRVELRDGLRAGFFDQRERYAKPLKSG
jgi:hypothetical protein